MKSTALLVALIAIELSAQTASIFTGTLFGHDGKPIRVSHVHLRQSNVMEPVVSVPVKSDGSWRMTWKQKGFYQMQFTGIDHQMVEIPLLLDTIKKLRFDVRLAANQYTDVFDSIDVLCDAPNPVFQQEGFPLKLLQRISDSLYQIEVSTTSRKLAYQLMGMDVNGHSINGTHSESFIYDNGGDYYSILTPKNGKVVITFEPYKLIRSSTQQNIRFPDSSFVRISNHYQELKRIRDNRTRAYSSFIQAGGLDSDFTFNVSAYADSLIRLYRTEINPLDKQMLLIRYFDLERRGLKKVDSAMAWEAIRLVPPSSPLWSELSLTSILIKTGNFTEDSEFIDTLLKHNPDENIRAYLVYVRLAMANAKKDAEKVRAAYKLLQSKYARTSYAKSAKTEYDLQKRILAGKKIPEFLFTSIDDSAVVTHHSMLGKYYLIDFWGTWCPPCVDEIENIQKAYDLLHKNNFEVLSIANDDIERIKKFRKEKFRMPWFNAIIGKNTEDVFEITAYPRMILVGPDGIIISAEPNELMGKSLITTVRNALGETRK